MLHTHTQTNKQTNKQANQKAIGVARIWDTKLKENNFRVTHQNIIMKFMQ